MGRPFLGVVVTCPTCGKEVKRSPSTAHRVFCSKICHGQIMFMQPEDFWSRLNKNGPVVRPELGPCWLWPDATTKQGYGSLRFQRRYISSHRLAWELANGRLLLPHEWVLHHCDVRCCCNPAHLFLGDHVANMADMSAKGRSNNGPSHASAKFTEAQIRNIRQQHAEGVTIYRLARNAEVSDLTISKIVHGRSYKNV